MFVICNALLIIFDGKLLWTGTLKKESSSLVPSREFEGGKILCRDRKDSKRVSVKFGHSCERASREKTGKGRVYSLFEEEVVSRGCFMFSDTEIVCNAERLSIRHQLVHLQWLMWRDPSDFTSSAINRIGSAEADKLSDRRVRQNLSAWGHPAYCLVLFLHCRYGAAPKVREESCNCIGAVALSPSFSYATVFPLKDAVIAGNRFIHLSL